MVQGAAFSSLGVSSVARKREHKFRELAVPPEPDDNPLYEIQSEHLVDELVRRADLCLIYFAAHETEWYTRRGGLDRLLKIVRNAERSAKENDDG